MSQPQHRPGPPGNQPHPRPGLPSVGATGPTPMNQPRPQQSGQVAPQHSAPAVPVAAPPQQAPVPPSEPISPQPQRDVDPRRPVFVHFALPVSTTDSLPGREITDVIGMVMGIATRPRDMAHNPEMAFINTSARQDAIGAMVQQAQEVGAHAVVAVRFDGGKISDSVTEIAAYGTAVRIEGGDDEMTHAIRLDRE